MCMRRCDDYEATLPRATLQSAASPTPTHEELLQMIETKKAARNEEAGAEPHNPPARFYKSARNEEAGAEPHNNPPARSYRSARNEEAGAEPHNNPPARSYKSARNEEAGAEPHNNPPARSYRSARNEEPGSEPKPRMFKSTGTAPRATKDSTHHHSKWEETKESVRHTVKDMSKSLLPQMFQLGALTLVLLLCSYSYRQEPFLLWRREPSSSELKDTIRAELKELVAKELKSALGNLQHKQIQLESTMTRMLLHQVESY